MVNTQSKHHLDAEETQSEIVDIHFKATKEVRDLIKQNALKHDKTMGAYLTELGLTGHVFKVDYNTITTHTHTLSEIKNQMNCVIKYMVNTNQADPQDITKILNLLTEVRDSENRLLSMVSREIAGRSKKIRKILLENRKEQP